VIFFLTNFARGFTLEHIVEFLNDYGDTFANNTLIFNYIKNKYSKLITSHLEITDFPFIFNQSAY